MKWKIYSILNPDFFFGKCVDNKMLNSIKMKRDDVKKNKNILWATARKLLLISVLIINESETISK